MTQMSKKEYEHMVKIFSPNSPVLTNCIKAFFVGGCICVFGELISKYLIYLGISEDVKSLLTVIILIFCGVCLTGFNIYSKFGRFAGAGSMIPITGFANAIASSAIEFKKEGYIIGIGTKLFSLAGPVLAYGVFSSFVVGIIYYISKII
ncbi:MAG: stage V sporulation protein AC [Defluviitaleaceae bacterium]|nr:stage V sporulation protein AC [Defluviitaleaceae bacterium]